MDWYTREKVKYIRLSRVNKPAWMAKIDDKYRRINNSIRRHIEKQN